MRAKLVRWGLVSIAVVTAALWTTSQGRTASISDLVGRWSGWGSITMANGTAEQVKCIATYFSSAGNLQQNLRCASQSYKIDATAKLKVENGQVSGDWEEKTYSAVGSVAGRINGTGNGFNLSIKGPSFSAAMAVSTAECKQTINITPHGFDISKISIGLSKC